jgi:hypothetical protein
VSGALLGPEGPAGTVWIVEIRGVWLVSWSGPVLVIHIGLLLPCGVVVGVWWWSLGVGAGCLLRTAQWTRASCSGVRRVIIL